MAAINVRGHRFKLQVAINLGLYVLLLCLAGRTMNEAIDDGFDYKPVPDAFSKLSIDMMTKTINCLCLIISLIAAAVGFASGIHSLVSSNSGDVASAAVIAWVLTVLSMTLEFATNITALMNGCLLPILSLLQLTYIAVLFGYV